MQARCTHKQCLSNLMSLCTRLGLHVTEEVEHQRKYIVSHIVSHVDAERRNSWCKVVFLVTIDADMTKFVCEWGFFEHAGLLCPHAIKLSIFAFM